MNNSNMGGKINDMINDAVNSMNFDHLSGYINSTFRDFVYGKPDDIKVSREYSEPRRDDFVHQSDPFRGFTMNKKNAQANAGIPVARKPAGTYSGPVLMVCGGLGILAFATGSLASLGIGALFSWNMMILSVISGCFTAACIVVTVVGDSLRRRIRRFRDYLNAMRGSEFIDIKELAAKTGRKEIFVKKDLTKMIETDMFLQGHIDDTGKYFIGNDAVYDKYLKARDNFEERRRQAEADEQRRAGESEEERRLRQVLEQGRESIRLIREANIALPGEEISRKLDDIESLVTQIFKRVEEKPSLLGDIRKFMDYYLPTTVKLVSVYTDFEKKPIQTEEIIKAKAEIEQTLDTITVAFRKLLSELYEDTVMDVSTDISVLKSMFARDGLADSEFDQGGK